MPTYYVGLGGNDANSGLSWAARKLTLNGAENVPVVAGDTVYVAPGVYREMLTCDVSGAAGSPITYIGDVSGENTDGIGGVVRITGSDNDRTATRANCIICVAQRNYRTFRGFMFDTVTQYIIYGGNNVTGTDWIIEDCSFQEYGLTGITGSIVIHGANQARWTIRRCVFDNGVSSSVVGFCIYFYNAVDVSNSAHIVENCILIGGSSCVRTDNVGGITVRNCHIAHSYNSVYIGAALAGGQTFTVNNCIITGCFVSLIAVAADGTFIEDYNNIFGSPTARSNVNVGANSTAYSPLFDFGILHSGASQVSGFRFPPPLFGTLSQWSQVRAIADTGAATEDVLGLTRPVTAGKRSWGAVQYVDMARDTATVHAGTASKKLADAGRDQIYVPTTAVSTVFSVYVYREANYAGVNPSMIIKQPGQADVTVTDAGAAGAWNLLTTTLTPAALPGYVVIELVSENTAAAGAYATYFDDLTVT